jgi:hypothetical protein
MFPVIMGKSNDDVGKIAGGTIVEKFNEVNTGNNNAIGVDVDRFFGL